MCGYLRVFENAEALDDTDALYTPQRLRKGVLMFDNIFGPGYVFSANRILDESLYAEQGAII